MKLKTEEALKSEKLQTDQELLTSEGFWQYRPFSRVVNWGKDFNTCASYVKQNILEALGFVLYTARKDYYSKWLNMQISESSPDI